MAKLDELQKEIEAIKKAINNPNNTNPKVKASMENVLEKLESQAKNLAESSPTGKTFKEEMEQQRKYPKKLITQYPMVRPTTTPERKKSVPQPKTKAEQDEDDYCAELIAQAKERIRKAKLRANAPQKTEATKNKEKLEKVFVNVKDRSENEEISKSELLKLISETESLLKLLKRKLALL